MSYDTVPKSASFTPVPFTVNTAQDRIDEFHQLLELSKIAPETYEATHSADKFGITREWLLNAKSEWEKYDWRKTEAHINSFPNFKAPIKNGNDTLDIHFAALFSTKTDAIPLLFIHGWPGSFLEFLDLMSILKSRYSPEELPYHVIVPSQPGYAFSSPAPVDHEFTIENTAEVFHELMLSLGFGTGYVVQGGDIGSRIARIMTVKYGKAVNGPVKGCHLNFCHMAEPEELKGKEYTATEQKGIDRLNDFMKRGSAYSFEHATRPATIGFALQASPISVLVWIGEKFLTWQDAAQSPISLTKVLDGVSLYWFTDTIARSFYPYRTNWVTNDIGSHGRPEWRMEDFGYSYFPQELAPIPRSWVETTGKLVWYNQHDKGGHFAALERPEALLKDVEDYVKTVWTA